MSGSSSISKSLPEPVWRVAQDWFGREAILNAPSKLNLRLKVEGRRADGYHLLSMINCSTSLQDMLCVVFTSDVDRLVTIEPRGALPAGGGENLVAKAFRSFWSEFGFETAPFGFLCRIKKNIPVGGGLGGGSADAGAMLRHLTTVFGASLEQSFQFSAEDTDARVMRAALACGADVPYAVRGGLCWVGGIGEEVVPFAARDIAPSQALIMVPPQAVPTVAFYDRFRRESPTLAHASDEVARALIPSKVGDLRPLVENDFEALACAMVPKIDEGLKVARQFFPHGTALTGSGSVFFSLVPEGDEPRASELSARLRGQGIASYLCALIFS